MRKIMITGGYGFIGSNLTRYWLEKHPRDVILIVDAMTYASRPQWVYDYVEQHKCLDRIMHEQINIQDQNAVARTMRAFDPDCVLHLAAESHVCRSIAGPHDFVHTNIVGTFNLLEEFRQLGKKGRFVYVSTDEVFGELTPQEPPFHEDLPLLPRSPYAASKAAGDLLVSAYHHTYKLDVCITNCSNNFGPNQNDEKLLARIISQFMNRQPMTVYGSGSQIRDWLHVDDHARAIDAVLVGGVPGERYCVGGEREMSNLDFIMVVHAILSRVTGLPTLEMIRTNDRPTDDFRYAVDISKIKRDLGWEPSKNFLGLLTKTIKWYLDRQPQPKCGAI